MFFHIHRVTGFRAALQPNGGNPPRHGAPNAAAFSKALKRMGVRINGYQGFTG
jgi:hypothetical protein